MILDPDMQHTDGIPWWEAPLPPWDHECTVQTTGFYNLERVNRCACGAMSRGRSGDWFDRNSTRLCRGEEPPPPGIRRSLTIDLEGSERLSWWRRVVTNRR